MVSLSSSKCHHCGRICSFAVGLPPGSPQTYAELPEDAKRCLGTYRLPHGQEGKQKEKKIGPNECDIIQLARVLDRLEAGMVVLEDLTDCAREFLEKCLELERIAARVGP
jgi:hypothetical protein